MHRRLTLGLALPASLSVPALASDALATKVGCAACHAPDRKLIGPSWRQVATKYEADLAMPPTETKQLSDAELRTLVAWRRKAAG